MGLFKNLLGTTLDEFRIGRNRSGDKYLYANTDDADKPALRFDDTNKKWELSNDGTDFFRVAVSNVAESEGVITTTTTDAVKRTGSGATPTEIAQLRTTFYTAENEYVLLTFNGVGYPDQTESIAVFYQIDDDGWVEITASGDGALLPQSLNWSAVVQVSTASSHTLKLAMSNLNGGGWTLDGSSTFFPTRYSVTQFRGGYVRPENVPVLEYNSASQIHLHAAPGASSLLRAMLNDGIIYTATAPLTIDLTVSGRGGLDSGTEASSTWYYAYLVKNSTGDGLSALCSINTPSTGPTGYDIWRYVGAFRNDGSSNILKFYQHGNFFRYAAHLVIQDQSDPSSESSPVEVDVSSFVPASAKQIKVAARAATSGGGYIAIQWWAYGDESGSALRLWYGTGVQTFVEDDISLPSSTKSFYQQRTDYDGADLKYWLLHAHGWTDGYLLEQSSQVQSKYSPDTALPQLTYSSASAINVAAAPGQNSTVLLTLQDGKQRSFTGTLAWSFSNGAADLGLDEGSEASSTWYYLYAVPKSGADDFLTVRASDNAPSSGPTGYTNWKYLGSFRNDGSSDIIPFFQLSRGHFKRVSYVSIDLGTTPDSDPVQYNIDTYVPKTAEAVEMSGYVQAGNGASMTFDVWITGHQSGTPVYRSAAPGSWTGQFNTALIPTPGTTKEIYYKRHGSGDLNWSLIEFNGWIDGYLSPAQCAGSGAPGKHAAAHQNGGSDEISTATPAANAIPKANGSGKLDSWITADAAAATASLRTLGTSSTSACAGNDSRLSDSRTPASHATSHKHEGGDEVGTATPAANAVPKADSSGTLNSWITTYLPPTTLSNLGNVATTGLPSGAQIYVTDVDGVYELETSGSYTPDGLGVIAGKDGGNWIGEVAGRWDDALGDVAQGVNAGALTYEVYRDTAYLMYCMRHDQNDTLHFRFQFPHRWKYDTNVVAHIHYLPLANPASNEVVHFDGYYAWSKIGGAAVPALTGWTTFSVTDTISNGDVYIQKIKTLATITPPSEARESSFLLLYLRRNSGTTDTYTTSKDHGTAAANVGLLGVDIHFRVNKLGTILELPS